MLIAKSLTLLTKAPKHWACNCNSPMDWLRLVSVRGADHQRTDFGQLLQLKANDQALGSVYPTVKNVFGVCLRGAFPTAPVVRTFATTLTLLNRTVYAARFCPDIQS